MSATNRDRVLPSISSSPIRATMLPMMASSTTGVMVTSLPVIVESLTMVVARVVGNDATIGFAQTGSLLELNVMLPVTAVSMLESIALLGAAADNFSARTIEGLEATERGPQLVEQGLMLATALAPVIGYDEAAKLAKEALRSGRTIRELALERGIAAEELDRLLDPAAMTEPGLGGGPAGG